MINDVAMCQHKTCPSQHVCLRHPASGTLAQPFQTYSLFELKNDENKCGYFLEKYEKTTNVRN